MALLVWLPLNGDLNNQGLSDITVNNHGATVSNNGKIGKCYEFNGDKQWLELSEPLTDLYNGDFTWALWVKPVDNTRGILISEYSGAGASNVALEIYNNRYLRIYWNAAFDNTHIYALPIDTWTHVAVTRQETLLKVYINGSLFTELTGSLGNRSSSCKIRIGDDYRGNSSNPVSFSGYLNDVRIYNHALSPKEVHEVAKGLVLHYKLDDPYVETTVNLAHSSTNYNTVNEGQEYAASKWGGDNGTITYYRSGGYNNGPYKVYHKTATGTGGIHRKLGDDIHILSGHTYTMSVYVKASKNLTDAAHAFNINRSAATPYSAGNRYITYSKQVPFTTEWTRLERTFTATDADAGDYGEMSILYNDDVSDYYVYYSCFQIEENDHATPYVDGYRNLEGTTNLLDYSNLKGHGSSWELQSSTFDGNPIYRNTVTSPNVGNNAGFSIKNSIYDSKLASATKVTISFYKRLIAVYGKNIGGYLRVVKSDDTEATYTWSFNKSNWANDDDTVGIWDYIYATVTIPSGCKYIKYCYVYTDNAPSGECDFANIQLELKDHPTPYVNGTRFRGINLAPKLTSENYTQSNYANRTSSEITDGTYHVSGYQSDTSADTSFTIRSNSFITLRPNTNYCLSFWCKSESAGDISFGKHTAAWTVLLDESNNKYYPEEYVSIGKNYNGSVIINFRTGDPTQYKLSIGFDTPNLFGVGSFMEFSNIVLSEYSDIYDCSGYENNGNIAGQGLVASTDSLRYTGCSEFNDSAIYGNLSCINSLSSASGCCWTYLTTLSGAQYLFHLGGQGSWNCKFSLDYEGGLRTTINGKEYASGITLSANTWYFLSVVWNGTNVVWYVNGQERATKPTSGTFSASNHFAIGARTDSIVSNTFAYKLNSGKISDLRIYSTALSAEDVKELYNVGAWIDNKYSIGSFEFDEINSGSNELNPFPYAIKQSGSSTYTLEYLPNGDFQMTGYIWPKTDYIPIEPTGKTYYYDVEYSNVAGNRLYVGFEKYDANKQTGSNSECQYVVSTASAANHVRVTGTINLSTANGGTAAYTKLRLLNNWENASGDMISTIHHISLKEVSTRTVPDIKKTGVFEGDSFIEDSGSSISKTGNIIANQIIEI